MPQHNMQIYPEAILPISTLLKAKYLVRVLLCGIARFSFGFPHTVCFALMPYTQTRQLHTYPGR